jgi:glycosyltransferase involved in cell wall biosynthesis
MKLTVLVPTYRRSKDLARCLEALKQQSCPMDEVLVIVRYTDEETHRFLQRYRSFPLPLKILTIERPGVIAAMNLGLDNASGDIIAITDDDAEPHSDWVQRIQAHFLADGQIGAVGGRDWIYESGTQEHLSAVPDSVVPVGKLQWIGRTIGNHHIGYGESREVDFLKGVNSSYRKTAIGNFRFDERLKGTGAQVHHEMGFCLLLKRHGWKVVYDPSTVVNHYPASRFGEDQRSSFNFESYYNASYNQTLVLSDHLSRYRLAAYLIWSVLIGTRGCFGVLQAMRFVVSAPDLALRKWMAATLGHFQAVIDWLKAEFVLTPTLKSLPNRPPTTNSGGA